MSDLWQVRRRFYVRGRGSDGRGRRLGYAGDESHVRAPRERWVGIGTYGTDLPPQTQDGTKVVAAVANVDDTIEFGIVGSTMGVEVAREFLTCRVVAYVSYVMNLHGKRGGDVPLHMFSSHPT